VITVSWKHIIKEDIKKYSRITWEKIDIDDIQYDNLPDDFKNMENGRNTIYFEARYATVEGVFDPDVRTWGVKSVGSYATAVSFTAEIVDEEDDDVIEVLEIETTDVETSDDNNGMPINPSGVRIKVDMKGQKDPKNFDVSVEVDWQGPY